MSAAAADNDDDERARVFAVGCASHTQDLVEQSWLIFLHLYV